MSPEPPGECPVSEMLQWGEEGEWSLGPGPGVKVKTLATPAGGSFPLLNTGALEGAP